jgi:hypothetical protein
LFGQLQFRPAQTLTGFSEEVGFQNIARITQSSKSSANVQLSKNDKPIEGSEQLLLRGMTLDVYTGDDPALGSPWQWVRSHEANIVRTAAQDEWLNLPGAPKRGDAWKQIISLRPTGTSVLFAMFGASEIRVTNRDRELKLRYSLADGTLQSESPQMMPLQYEVISRDERAATSILDTMGELGRAFRRSDSDTRVSHIDRRSPTTRVARRSPAATGRARSPRAAPASATGAAARKCACPTRWTTRSLRISSATCGARSSTRWI